MRVLQTVMTLAAILLVFVRAEDVDDDDEFFWQLENYNGWNLPFAKRCEIVGRTDGDHPHNLATNTYVLEVDSSAFFSVIFLTEEVFTDYSKETDLVALNYTILGNEPQLTDIYGVWTDVTITIPQTNQLDSKNYTADFTIFVALGLPPDAGLDGTLSVVVVPDVMGWGEVSLMAKLEANYKWPTVYVSYNFVEKDGLYAGVISFSKETTLKNNNLTFGGQIIIQEQLDLSLEITKQPVVTLFMQITLSQISFNYVLLQETQIFVTDFAKYISLTPAAAATHMPTSIYNYMDTNFFDWLCTDVGVDDNDADKTSTAIPLKNCQCDGLNYYGMPNIDYSLMVDQYETDYTYTLAPIQFEMAPKIDTSLRVSKCALGLWNLQETNPNEADSSQTNQFAVGQNFIRSYNMTIKFAERADSNDISMAVFIGNAGHRPAMLNDAIVYSLCGLFLFAYLGWFTVLKFRRVSREKIEYTQVQQGLEKVSKADKKRMALALQQENAFIAGKQAGLSHVAIERLAQLNKPRKVNKDKIPLRQSQTFAEKRVRAYSITMTNKPQETELLLAKP